MTETKRLGLIVNAAAGLGGSLGFKGSDGLYAKLLSLGGVPRAPAKAARALGMLEPLKQSLVVVTGAGSLGGDIARDLGFQTEIIYTPEHELTTKADTATLSKKLAAADVSLILFAGGDGTARDIYEAVGDGVPALGIPAGVKIHSAVYAKTPEKAGELALQTLKSPTKRHRLSEVMDIDEAAFRENRVSSKLFGYLTTPYDRNLLQAKKSGGGVDEGNNHWQIAYDLRKMMKPGVLYIIGPGSTTMKTKELLSGGGTLLGVDLFLDQQMIAADVNETQILSALAERPAKIVLTPIGSQGNIFGRGNQQLSPQVIRAVGKSNIIIVSGAHKLAELGGNPLFADTGDPALDAELTGYYRVLTGQDVSHMVKVN